MILTIIIAFVSLMFLIISHEFGHFYLAKRFGIKVEEFGIGYPPRIWGKKFGETIYSLNWIPFGAFVRIYGHEERIDDPRSFSNKPIWQRALVILGGVVSFWIISIIILSIVMAMGAPTIIEDNESKGLKDIKVQMLSIAKNSPAEEAGLQVGDAVLKFRGGGDGVEVGINKVEELQNKIKENRGSEVVMEIQRGEEILEIKATPRVNNTENEGALGVSLVRTALKSYPLYIAPIKGAEATWNLTLMVIDGWKMVFSSLLGGQGVPQGTEMRGIIGIFDLFVQAGGLGAAYFLQFIAVIAISLALVNVLPIPALDGGWFVLLMIEGIRKKPLPEKIERGVSSFFFILLISLMVFVTFKDIARLF